MTLQQFRDVLLKVTDQVFHHTARNPNGPYIVWNEGGASALYASDSRLLKAQRVQVDYFSTTEYDATVGNLCETLHSHGVWFEEPIPDYDEDGKYIRYIIECTIVGDV